ncbi:MAG: NAD-dependent epimerase/dehydratase family protein [Ruminococcaceae bacterium]|nr:NAD-dependent epimerase/dehydratase family protein [Oscillospiraceae bacterium]
MKKVLITGANSYIGTSFENYIKENYPDDYIVDTIDMMDEHWNQKSFVGYDAVFHVAGIAHSDNGKISDEKAKLYYAINTDLTVETAIKAKSDGVKQFVFMSSAIVYGKSAPIGKKKVITKESSINPANCYGDSKIRAEEGIKSLCDNDFNIVILRSPMIYGKGSKGNYPILAKFAAKTPIFPYVNNERSMLYIENLCEFVRLMVENNENGIFWPQNDEYVNTSSLVQMIANVKGKKILLIKGFGWALIILSYVCGLVNKAFGNLSYDKELSKYKTNYCVVSLEQSIKKTEL